MASACASCCATASSSLTRAGDCVGDAGAEDEEDAVSAGARGERACTGAGAGCRCACTGGGGGARGSAGAGASGESPGAPSPCTPT